MNPADRADAAARALNLLDEADPAASDPRFLRDPGLLEDARLARETAADVWLAVSPLHVAPPEVLRRIMAEIAPQTTAPRAGGRRFLIGIAAAGWAAAAALLIGLWPRSEERPAHPPQARSARPDAPADPQIPPPSPPVVRKSHDDRLRNEILRLRARLEDVRAGSEPGAPRVIALHPPGETETAHGDSQRRIQIVLANALRAALEAESGVSSDGASLVIERGWLKGGLPVPDDGGMVRHRNFPESSWKDLGLLRSDDGEYYDASRGMIWFPDPKGPGFIGRKKTDADDLAAFHAEDLAPSGKPVPEPRTRPEGFIVENPADHTAEVIIDRIAPPAEGNGHVIVLTDQAGNTDTIPVTPAEPAPPEQETPHFGESPEEMLQPGGVIPASTLAGTLVLTLQATNLASFRLLERPLVPNGQPDRVIVESQP